MTRLGFIASQFPRYDEAFILRELSALARGPWDVVIFSLRPCRDRVIHAQAQALQPRTIYAPFACSRDVWRSHGWFLRRTPRAYLGALWWVFSRHWRHPVILVKTLAFFPKTVHFARLALERKLTHLHAVWATYPAASALLISRLTGIPFSVSGHAHDLYTTNPTLAEKARAARFVVTCTQENKRYLERVVGRLAGWPVRRFARSSEKLVDLPNEERANAPTRQPANVIVSYHGVDLSTFAPVPKPADGPCRLLVVGSLFACKGLETLIDSCRLLREEGVAFTCTIAGGGPLERTLRRRIARHRLASQVTITGYVSQEAVAELYQQAHLFLLPLVSKIHWGIPNVLIEALATKTPVISCHLPSLQELLEHGRSGWIVPERNPRALAQAVKTLWADPGLRAQIAERGYQRVAERFSLEQTGEALRRVFADYTGNGVGTHDRLEVQT